MKEAEITISGVTLSEGQSLAVRVAVELFSDWCYDNRRVLGAELATNYTSRLNEVRELIGRTCQ
jgi:hypothetical protein